MKLTNDQIINKIHNSLNRLAQLVQDYGKSQNPQVLELIHTARGERIALYSVLDALNGNSHMLDVLESGNITSQDV